MRRRYVTLPNGRQCPLGNYVAAWKALLTMPPGARVAGFGHFLESRDDVLRALWRGLEDRINTHLPHYGRGRKWRHEWQAAASRVAWKLNGRRIITTVDEAPLELRMRLAHRLYTREELA